MPADHVAEEAWRKIEQLIQQMVDERNLAKWEAFRDWAFKEIFFTEAVADSISDTDIETYTKIDGTDDYEIDGYTVDDDERLVCLFQAKDKSQYALGELEKFIHAPQKILDRRLVQDCKNVEVKYLHTILTQSLQQGYSLRLIPTTSGTFSKRAAIRLKGLAGEQSWNLKVSERELRVQTVVEPYDRKALISLFREHEAKQRPTVPQVDLTLAGHHEFTAGGYKTLVAHVPARDIVSAFRTYSYTIFEQNPRKWLGPRTKPYIQMSKTLQDQQGKRIFHILNNGLSALCNSYSPSPPLPDPSGTIKVRFTNFQIVNGCQTTVFLQRNPDLLDEVYVAIRVTETGDSRLAGDIAETTNTQTGLRAEQFRSNEKQQKDLQDEFERMTPPWCYEIKAGSWAYDTDQSRYKENGTYRHLTIKDVAQAALAFIGMPGEAFEDTRAIFEHKENPADTKRHYEDAFPQGITAQQLLLPACVHRKVARLLKGLDKTAREPFNYGEIHLVWLMGVLLREHYKANQSGFLSSELSKRLCQTLDDWFDNLFNVAADALIDCVVVAKDAAEKASETFNQRNFYRSRKESDNYKMIRKGLDTTVQKSRIRARDPLKQLPK